MLEDERTPAFRKHRAKAGRGETHAELSRHPREPRPDKGKEPVECDEQGSGSEGARSQDRVEDTSPAKDEDAAPDGD
jgi:hypothetical protein